MGYARAGSSPAFGTILKHNFNYDYRESGFIAGSLFSSYLLRNKEVSNLPVNLSSYRLAIFLAKPAFFNSGKPFNFNAKRFGQSFGH